MSNEHPSVERFNVTSYSGIRGKEDIDAIDIGLNALLKSFEFSLSGNDRLGEENTSMRCSLEYIPNGREYQVKIKPVLELAINSREGVGTALITGVSASGTKIKQGDLTFYIGHGGL